MTELSLLTQSDINPVSQFVFLSLKSKIEGNSKNYQSVVAQLVKRDDKELLWRLFVVLNIHSSIITQKSNCFYELIQSIYSYDWKSEEKVSTAFINLLVSMVSSNATFIVPTFHFLIKSFLNDWMNETNMNQIHFGIQSVLSIAPTGQSELFNVIVTVFPHKRFDVLVIQRFVTQLYGICDYFPSIEIKLIDLLISKCLEMDVEILIEDSGDVKIEENENNMDNDDLNNDDNIIIDHGNNNNIYFSDVSKRGLKHLSESQKLSNEIYVLADKLDSVLVSLIIFIQKRFSSGDNKDDVQTSSTNILKLFQALLNIFEEKILITHKSKFVQFIIFYLCGIDSDNNNTSNNSNISNNNSMMLCELFSNRLFSLFTSSSLPLFKRHSSVMYLASFLARAKFVSFNHVKFMTERLLDWAFEFVKRSNLNNNSSTTSTVSFFSLINSTSFSSYTNYSQHYDYSSTNNSHSEDFHTNHNESNESFLYCVQTILYIICFHGFPLLNHLLYNNQHNNENENENEKYLPKPIQILLSKLQPLKFCISSVTHEFCRLLQFYVDTNLNEEDEENDDDNDDDLENEEENENNLNFVLKKIISQYSNLSYSSLILKNNSNNSSHFTNNVSSCLDSFFPFDPCLLISTNIHIEKYYRVWKDIVASNIANTPISKSPYRHNHSSNQSNNNDYNPSSSQSSVASPYGELLSPNETPSQLSQYGLLLLDSATENSNHEFFSEMRFRRPRQFSISSTGSW